MRRTIIGLLALVVFVGCGGGASYKPVQGATNHGYTTFTSKPYHFSLEIPASWSSVDASTLGDAQAMRDAIAQNPGMKKLFGSDPAKAIASGTKFLAGDLNATINIVVNGAPGTSDSDVTQLPDVMRQQYATLGGTVGTPRYVTIAGHKALSVPVDLTLSGLTKHMVQDVLFANGYSYVLTLSGTSPQFAHIVSTFTVS